MIQTAPDLFDRLTALADPTRSRMLLLLEKHELTVSELCAVLQLPQSTASRHLKTLGDEGWVVSRSEGTRRLYTMAPARLDAPGRRIWGAVREQLAESPLVAHDQGRLRSVLAARRSKAEEFFSTAWGQWDRVRAELFGARVDLIAMLALLDEQWTIGDLGCGTGELSATLAPFVRRVIAVDASSEMLDAARRKFDSLGLLIDGESDPPRAERGVATRLGELEALPLEDGELDVALLSLVLHYVPDPSRALAEAARAIRADGRVLVVDMLPHTRDEYRQTMGHVWQGFAPAQMTEWMTTAGLAQVRVLPLPADPQAKGPTLFVATGRKK